MSINVTLTNLENLQNENSAVSAINNNNDVLETALTDAVSRSGASPNQMQASLDMNGNRILNLPDAILDQEPVTKSTVDGLLVGEGNVPSGGTTNQVLRKNSNTSFDMDWATAGLGTVTSIGVTAPTGIDVTGSPVTSSGTIDLDWTTPPTGSNGFVRATAPTITSPVLVTPDIGVATATSVNKLAITPPATSATLTVANGKTFQVNNSISLSGVDSSTVTLQGTDTYVGRTTTDTLTNKTISGTNNTISGIAPSSLASQAASSLLGNATTSAATPTAFTIGGLTQKATPLGTDLIVLQDQAAAGELKYATVSSIGSSSGVSSLNGQTGALVSSQTPQGRITLTSGVPVMGTSVSAATTVYYTPYVGNMVPIYDGTDMIPTVFTELSQATTDATKSPAAVAADSVYDLFVWNDGGTIRCTRGPAWSTSITRGYSLTMVNGILLNTSSITNGPAASRGTWVGTISSNSSSQIDFIYGSSAAGGSAASFYVWNAYNRVLVSSFINDSTSSWTYSSTTVRSLNNSTGNRFNFVTGAAEEGIHVSLCELIRPPAVISAFGEVGIRLDGTTAHDTKVRVGNPTTQTMDLSTSATRSYNPQFGRHFIQATESGNGTDTYTAFGGAFNNLTFTTRM